MEIECAGSAMTQAWLWLMQGRRWLRLSSRLSTCPSLQSLGSPSTLWWLWWVQHGWFHIRLHMLVQIILLLRGEKKRKKSTISDWRWGNTFVMISSKEVSHEYSYYMLDQLVLISVMRLKDKFCKQLHQLKGWNKLGKARWAHVCITLMLLSKHCFPSLPQGLLKRKNWSTSFTLFNTQRKNSKLNIKKGVISVLGRKALWILCDVMSLVTLTYEYFTFSWCVALHPMWYMLYFRAMAAVQCCTLLMTWVSLPSWPSWMWLRKKSLAVSGEGSIHCCQI